MLSIYANYPVMYSLSEKAAVNMQGTVFTLVGLKIVPTIKNLIYVFFTIVRCDAVENYMFLRDSLQLVLVVGL